MLRNFEPDLHPNNKQYLIIAGTGKSGTTSLFKYLGEHPDICPSDVKEVTYFSAFRRGLKELPESSLYFTHFSKCIDSQIHLEASPGYFYGGIQVINAINEIIPNSRILIILREPISRLYSFFNFNKSRLKLPLNLSMEKYIEYSKKLNWDDLHKIENQAYWGLEECFYDKYILPWIEELSSDRVKILFFENLFNDICGTLEEICEWLNIESEDYIRSLQVTIENKSMGFKNSYLQKIALKYNQQSGYFLRSHPIIKNLLRSVYYAVNGKRFDTGFDIGDVEKLNKLFKPHNTNLAKMLWEEGYRNLPEWLFNELQVNQ